ncbi:hypothetical protein GJ744_010003 [Endocarpon pusillum]|uniref:Heterokaryon incompatibility domain-containing protein n=1 Tax=Endocarpon pusillum TaxID=364733 RepID=A0A8H7AGT9_9EURO|nr:hypothetical protein GJ744_010003 [Endocarpon pusillum]
MLCSHCQEIFTGERNLKLDGSLRYHLYWVPDLMQGVRQRCFICSALKRAVLENGKLNKLEGIEGLEATGGVDRFISKYSMRQGTGDTIGLTFRLITHHAVRVELITERHMLIRPWNAKTKETVSTELGKSTSSPSSLDMATKWYKQCRASHSTCGVMSPQLLFVPSRLIDVGHTHNSRWRILTGDDLSMRKPHDMEYMTLSHCWGGSSFLTLTSTNLERLRQEMPVSVLPKTFQEALYVTRRLGCQLLWIDSLCIMQDSWQDWRQESSKMSGIYSNAVCNIAATGSSNPYGGLFQNRDVVVNTPCIVQTNWKDDVNHLVVITDCSLDVDQVMHAPLNQRGWVFQERLLSRRLLQFANEQIFWRCQQLDACEAQPRGVIYDPAIDISHYGVDEISLRRYVSQVQAGTTPSEPVRDDDHADAPNFYNLWQSVIRDYSRLSLTQTTDKLVALSGVVDILEQACDDQYLAGLWRSHLPAALLWHRRLGTRLRPFYAHFDTRRSARAPSWSWASLDGSIILPWRTEDQDPSSDYKPLATLIAATVWEDPAAVNQYRVKGLVRLQAFLMQATFRKTVDLLDYGKLESDAVDNSILAMEDTPLEASNISLFCAVICSRLVSREGKPHCIHQGLLLRPPDVRTGSFSRFGYFHILQECKQKRVDAMEDDVLRHFEQREIEIC